MKATWNGVTIAESDDTVLVEGNHYFPMSALNRDYVTFSNHKTTCPWKGEALHTENSYKFSIDGLRALALRAGFGIGPVWTDPERLFSVHWLPAAQ